MKLQLYNNMVDVVGVPDDGMTDDAFFDFCQQNRELRMERDHNKQLFIMAPTGFYTGSFNSTIITEIHLWNRKFKPGKVVDSSTGFILPDGSVLSPDAAWISNGKINLLTEAEKQKSPPLCPEFIVALKGNSDALPALKNKLLKWIENGALLTWLIIPETQLVFIYRADNSISIVQGFTNKLSGENVLPGFELDLGLLV